MRPGSSNFPNSFALNKAAGRLAACLLRLTTMRSAIWLTIKQRDMTDPEIAYYLGSLTKVW